MWRELEGQQGLPYFYTADVVMYLIVWLVANSAPGLSDCGPFWSRSHDGDCIADDHDWSFLAIEGSSG